VIWIFLVERYAWLEIAHSDWDWTRQPSRVLEVGPNHANRPNRVSGNQTQARRTQPHRRASVRKSITRSHKANSSISALISAFASAPSTPLGSPRHAHTHPRLGFRIGILLPARPGRSDSCGRVLDEGVGWGKAERLGEGLGGEDDFDCGECSAG
jgi:hypothetical protein